MKLRYLLPLAFLAGCTQYVTWITLDSPASDAGAGGGRSSSATGTAGGDAGADDAANDAINPACPPIECQAVNPVTCEVVPLSGSSARCDGGYCVDGGCVAYECFEASEPCTMPGLDDAGWVAWSCGPHDAPSPYCITDHGVAMHSDWCCPPTP